MTDRECVAFLKWCLPRLGLRWAGYRKVHRTVCKRLGRRVRALSLADLQDYQALLDRSPTEWAELETLCRIPISRFYRDREVFDHLGEVALPDLAQAAARRGDRTVRCWSLGCASGEEPFTVALVWAFRVRGTAPEIRIEVLGTDADPELLRRAESACYRPSSLAALPAHWVAEAFAPRGAELCLRPAYRDGVRFKLEDVRAALPEGRFDLILCRNSVFTYFDRALQAESLRRIATRLRPDGLLVIGRGEALPAGAERFTAAAPALPVYRFAGAEPRGGRTPEAPGAQAAASEGR